MKVILSIAVSVLLVSGAHGALNLEDHFNYSTGTLGTQGASGGWSSSNSGVTVTTNNLDGSALGLVSSSGSKVTTTTSSSSGTYNQFSSGILSGDVYVSFLVRVNSTSSISTSGQPIVGLLRAGSASSYYADVYLRLNGPNVEVGLSKLRAVTQWHSAPLVVGNTYLVVARYHIVLGTDNDGVALWINPSSLGGAEPAADISFSSGSDGNNSTGIGRCYIYGGAAADVDELRVGTAWADVTPASGVIPPSFIPYVTQTLLSNDSLIMRGTNGPANQPYAVVASTNLTLPRNQWTGIASNAFDSQGNFDCTNPISPGNAFQFYQVRVGIVPPPPVGPTIVTNPTSKAIAVGQSAVFTVAATGTAPLVYRWYLNTNTVLASTTATLTINNAQLTNTGVYSATVSNIAGVAISDFATLTVTNILAPPSITTQPQNQSVVLGQPANFSVTATGTVPLSYQWYFNTNTPLLDKTNSSLLISSVTSNDIGGYSVVVTNALGSTNSTVAMLAIVDAPTNGNWFVSPTGSNTNPGTIDAPFYSLSNAVNAAQPGDIIYMRGGTFTYGATMRINKAGTAANPIQIVAYPGEHPILDYSTWHPATETIRGGARGIYITTNAQYWVLKGLEIQYAPDNGIKSEGGHITFEQCIFHHNGDSGLQIGLNKDTLSFNPDPEHAAAYNYVLNCDSYRNVDPATDYENADGFACKLYAGVGNRFNGCRAWENSDDGWDCYQTEFEIVIENCWSWHNGDPSIWGFSSFNGDGNGFKLGGDDTFCPILVQDCVALDCKWGTTVGFAFNNNTAPITLYNCSALNCGRSYKFGQNGNVFKNCLDWNSTRPAPVDITGTSTQVNNSWNLPVTVTSGDFASVLAADAGAPREADGSLPNNNFARLVSGSDLIDKGVDVGLPFNGSAPDLGAFEFVP